eukprot:jgi/Mesvir1/28862/Mv09985-RA.3
MEVLTALLYLWLTLSVVAENSPAPDDPSGRPLPAASLSALGFVDGLGIPAPLSSGHDTIPLGMARVFKGDYPDIFFVSGRMSMDQGLFLYEYMGRDDNGAPYFQRRLQVTHPFKGLLPPPGCVVETDGEIHGFWHVESNIIAHTLYDRDNHGFAERRELHIQGLPRAPTRLGYLPRAVAGGDLLLEIVDRKSAPPGRYDSMYHAPEYNPADGELDNNPRDSAGIWRAGMPHAALYSVPILSILKSPSQPAKRVTASEHDIQFTYCGVTHLLSSGPAGQERSAVTGSVYGSLFYFRNMAEAGVAFRNRQPLTSVSGQVLRHPTPGATPLMYPGTNGQLDMLVGGEGALYYYKNAAAGTEGSGGDVGAPTFHPPRVVHEAKALLYGGSHPVPSLADWNNDGRTDLVVGNAEGRLLVHYNIGSDETPSFLPGIPLSADGDPIVVQPGYLAVEGPAETRYGYACPAVVDWNGDGLPDLILADATVHHTLYLNVGTPSQPCLTRGRAIYNDGLDMHGPWRVRPGITRVNGRLLYVTLDDSNDLHAFFRVDDYNLKDTGKLHTTKGKPIRAHFLTGGASGRITISLLDFDLDGVMDLILAVPKHAVVPGPESGLPSSIGVPGGVVLLMRGKKEAGMDLPHFKSPELLQHQGTPIITGREDGSAIPVRFGPGRGPHILVAEESGRFVIYYRKYLSSDASNRFPEEKRSPKEVEDLSGLGGIKAQDQPPDPLDVATIMQEYERAQRAEPGPRCGMASPPCSSRTVGASKKAVAEAPEGEGEGEGEGGEGGAVRAQAVDGAMMERLCAQAVDDAVRERLP